MKFLFWSGLLFFFGSFFLVRNSYKDFDLDQNGALVNMKIEKLPVSCSGTRINHYATFNYEGEMFTKIIPAGYCEQHAIGETVRMKYLNGESNILFPNESVWLQFNSSLILGLFGLAMVITQTIRNKKRSQKNDKIYLN